MRSTPRRILPIASGPPPRSTARSLRPRRPCAETDIYAPPQIIEKVRAAIKRTGNEVEIYPGTHHGFAFPKRPVYDRDAAERHWERLLALYRRNLS